MEDPVDLKAQTKKLSAQAIAMKMNLHDLSEDLPTGWEKIPDVAAQTYDIFRQLAEVKTKLKALGG